MTFRISEARKDLQAFNLKKLFIEQLGWDNPGADITIRFNGQSIKLKSIAQKRGFSAFTVPPIDGKIPDYATRRKIEVEVRKIVAEHVLIFTNAEGDTLRWQWVRREAGKPSTAREFEFTKGKNGDPLLHRLEKMYFSLEDEETVQGIVDASARVRSAFNVEKVTKKFYERFKDQHTAFMKFIKGIPDKQMQQWYVSVTLNRLMFIYFIQKKRFLDNDPDYLRHHLEESKKKGKDKFYTSFLCPLFFEGLAKRQRAPEYVKLLGNIPYLNGGIFERRQIEELHGEKIQIPDQAFERLFDFFDEYRWHLDERPNRNDNEINPDVLGYIFEKYINQKQMGAYYTKEDITEYISKNTIIPHLFDAAQKECRIAFEGEGSVWRHLQADPDRYIYAAVRYGVENALPAEIAAGESDPKRREGWNKPAPEEFALPTEIWREVVARRRRYQEVKEKLSRGEVKSINDLITLNLDIRQFAQDVIQDSDADLLLAFWKAISQIKVLDPTVGSGAFLFAALNVLEPLYEACVERMSALVEELDRSGEKHSPKKYEPFRKVLAQVQKRPDEDYFIFKSIIINNLYGVDIMEEAVEICKLRLFLKLAAQVEPDASQENLGIEPLPDIDFNIRAGNTLVGFATREDVERSVNMGMTGGKEKVQAPKLMALDEEKSQLKRIEEKAADVDRLYQLFRQQQTELGGEVRPEDKRELQKRLRELEAELNLLLARQYGIQPPSPGRRGDGGEVAYQKWLESHKPFHWFVEFYGIMNEGGFDVIIGNPPYVEYSKVKDEYKIQNYKTEKCGNLYAFIMERSLDLLHETSRSGLIVLIGSMCTERMDSLQSYYSKKCSVLHLSTYSGHTCPGVLFEGVANRYAIWISKIGKPDIKIYSSKYLKWYSSERDLLFQSVNYQETTPFVHSKTYKNDNVLGVQILNKLHSQNSVLGNSLSGKESIYIYTTPIHWVKAFTFKPYFKGEGKNTSTQLKELKTTKESKSAIVCLLNSSLFFWWWITRSDCYHLISREIELFPIDMGDLMRRLGKELDVLQQNLMKDLNAKSTIGKRNQKTTGLVEFQVIDPKLSKPIIDEIDRALARHYGLTDEELDFIINYDIKYRMGASAEEEGDE